MDIAVASAGARIVLSADGDTIESARISLGAVGPTVVSANDAAASLAGQPATALPAGRSSAGLPLGLQAIGPYLEDRTTLRFAQLLEREWRSFEHPPGY